MENLKEQYAIKNGYILTKVYTKDETLANGIKFQDTRGKRDIISATCLLAEDKYKIPEHALVYFPLYAALDFKLDGENYLLVNFDDVILVEKVPD